MLLAEARHPKGHVHQQRVFEPELVVRESTSMRRLDGVA